MSVEAVTTCAMTQAPHCSACDRACELTSGAELWPHRPDLADKPSWICRGCKARVGCHPGTTRPLGTPADAQLRRARMMLHDGLLDPLWRLADRKLYGKRAIRRARTYRWLGEKLEIPRELVHVGLFDLETCRRAWRILRGVTYRDIHEHRMAQKRAQEDDHAE